MSGDSFPQTCRGLVCYDRLPVVLHGVLHCLCGKHDSRGCALNLSELALLHGFFWFSFGGCLLALFAYDFFHFVIELLPDVVQVASRFVISLWSKSHDTER